MLFCGDHKNYFEAKEVFQEINQSNIENSSTMQQDKYFGCLKKKRKPVSENMLNKFGEGMKEMVSNMAVEIKKSKSIQPQMTANEIKARGVMKKMVTVLNLENNQVNGGSRGSNDNSTAELDENGKKKPRSGKELWAIARKLTYEKSLAIKRTSSMMHVVRAEKIRRQ